MSKCSRRDFLGSLGSFSAAAAIPGMGALAGLAPGSLKARTVTAVQLAEMIRNKEIGSLELTQYFIDRIERVDTQLNAVVVRDFDRAVDAQGERRGPPRLHRSAPVADQQKRRP